MSTVMRSKLDRTEVKMDRCEYCLSNQATQIWTRIRPKVEKRRNQSSRTNKYKLLLVSTSKENQQQPQDLSKTKLFTWGRCVWNIPCKLQCLNVQIHLIIKFHFIEESSNGFMTLFSSVRYLGSRKREHMKKNNKNLLSKRNL